VQPVPFFFFSRRPSAGGWRTLSLVFDRELPLGAALFDGAKRKGAALDFSFFDLILARVVLNLAFSVSRSLLKFLHSQSIINNPSVRPW
jgi:hypothetical protein